MNLPRRIICTASARRGTLESCRIRKRSTFWKDGEKFLIDFQYSLHPHITRCERVLVGRQFRGPQAFVPRRRSGSGGTRSRDGMQIHAKVPCRSGLPFVEPQADSVPSLSGCIRIHRCPKNQIPFMLSPPSSFVICLFLNGATAQFACTIWRPGHNGEFEKRTMNDEG